MGEIAGAKLKKHGREEGKGKEKEGRKKNLSAAFSAARASPPAGLARKGGLLLS